MTATEKARALIAKRSTEDLITDFEVTNDTAMTPELPTVRGWIMDELEKRDFDAFAAWIDSEDESPRKYFIKDEDEADDINNAFFHIFYEIG